MDAAGQVAFPRSATCSRSPPPPDTLEVSGAWTARPPCCQAWGRVALQGLVAHDAIARLEGTGDVEVHATSALDATLTGTGSIVYSGSPSVTAHNMGTGSITGV